MFFQDHIDAQPYQHTTTRLYKPPEMITEGKFDEKTDVWSLGVIAYEMMVLERPFATEGEVLRGEYKKLSSNAPPILAKLVPLMLAQQPEDRPTMMEVKTMLQQN